MTGRPDRDDLKRMGLLVLVLDCDVLAFSKAMLMAARFLVARAVLIVVDHPGRPSGPARAVDQNAVPLVFMGPEAADPAVPPLLRPLLLVEMLCASSGAVIS